MAFLSKRYVVKNTTVHFCNRTWIPFACLAVFRVTVVDYAIFCSPEIGGPMAGFQRAVSDPQILQSFGEAFQPYCYAMPMCDFSDPYRQTDGQCNNPINPLLGSSFTPQQRVLPNAYDNCKSVTSIK